MAAIRERMEGLPGLTLRFEISAESLTCDSWFDLLSNGITVYEDAKPAILLVATLPPKPKPELSPLDELLAAAELSVGNGTFVFGLGLGNTSKFKVQASSIYSYGSLMQRLCKVFQNHRDHGPQQGRPLSHEGFSLRVPCNFGFRLGAARERIANATGANIYFHKGTSLGYYLDGSNDGCPTIAGTWKQIKDALNMLSDQWIETYSSRFSGDKKECKRCSMRLTAPTTETLDRLVSAVQVCRENPGTLGVDLKTKAFFAVKTVNDMKLLLEAVVSNERTTGENVAPLTLAALNYPKGVF